MNSRGLNRTKRAARALRRARVIWPYWVVPLFFACRGSLFGANTYDFVCVLRADQSHPCEQALHAHTASNFRLHPSVGCIMASASVCKRQAVGPRWAAYTVLVFVLLGLNAVHGQPRERQLPDGPPDRTMNNGDPGQRGTGPPDPPPIPPYNPNVCAGYCVNVPPATWPLVSH